MNPIPATIIDTLDFSPLTMTPVHREAVLNAFNTRVLEYYQLSGQMLQLDALRVLGQNVVTAYVSQQANKPQVAIKSAKKVGPKKVKGLIHWQNDRSIVEAFIAFVDVNFDIVEAPYTKFKAVIVAFNSGQTQWRLAEQWNDAYAPLMAELKIATERIVNPAFAKGPGLGTRYVALRVKTPGLIKVIDTVEGISEAAPAVSAPPVTVPTTQTPQVAQVGQSIIRPVIAFNADKA